MRVAVVALALGGCQIVFPLEEPPIDSKCRTKATAIFDDFSDGQLGSLWTTAEDVDTSVVEESGHVTFTMNAIDSQAQLISVPFVDLLDSEATIQIDYDTLPTDNFLSFALLSPDVDAGDRGQRVEFRVVHDRATDTELLEAAHVVDTELLVIRSVPYDKATMNVWKIERDGDSTIWSAGPVGGPLQRIADFPLPDLRFVRPRVTAHEQALPFVATASHFNDGDHSKVCGADTLVDDFESGLDPVQWGRVINQGCKLVPQAGGVELVDGGNVGACELGATGLYDLFHHPLTIEVDAVVNGFAGAYLDAASLTGTTSSFLIENDQLVAETSFIGQPENRHQAAAYSADQHKYWRFEGFDEGSGPQLKWSVSGDGTTFTEFARSNQLDDLRRVRFAFGVFNYNPADGSMVRFDNVNVAP